MFEREENGLQSGEFYLGFAETRRLWLRIRKVKQSEHRAEIPRDRAQSCATTEKVLSHCLERGGDFVPKIKHGETLSSLALLGVLSGRLEAAAQQFWPAISRGRRSGIRLARNGARELSFNTQFASSRRSTRIPGTPLGRRSSSRCGISVGSLFPDVRSPIRSSRPDRRTPPGQTEEQSSQMSAVKAPPASFCNSYEGQSRAGRGTGISS